MRQTYPKREAFCLLLRFGSLFLRMAHVTTLALVPSRSAMFCRRSQRSVSPLQRAFFSSMNDQINDGGYDFKYRQLMDACKLSLAPMMEYTDRHFRHLVRLISNRTLLYTEMVAANALSHERQSMMQRYQNEHGVTDETEIRRNYDDQYLQRYLAQGSIEPLEGASVLQLGGSDPEQLYEATQTVLDMSERGHCDYTAINLNCGCPSPKVAGKGCFGAALMDDPSLVAQLTRAMYEGCEGKLPITVKCRIGTDSHQPFTQSDYAALDPEQEYRRLCDVIETVASEGVVTDFGVHARIAVLTKSFSPADNRKVPPLKYDFVRRLVRDYPEMTFTLNGGVNSITQALSEFDACPGLSGVMIGRGWAADPWSFAMADRLVYDDTTKPVNRLQILEAYGRHADNEETRSDPVKIRRFLVKAVTPLFTGEPNAKRYRIALDAIAALPKKLLSKGGSLDKQPPLSELILSAAMEHLSEETLLRTPEESYERVLWEENKRSVLSLGTRTQSVVNWQARRKLEENAQEQRAG